MPIIFPYQFFAPLRLPVSKMPVWRGTKRTGYLILDRDQKFGFDVIAAVKTTRTIPKRTSFRSPRMASRSDGWEAADSRFAT
jgi:hypothetical protein